MGWGHLKSNYLKELNKVSLNRNNTLDLVDKIPILFFLAPKAYLQSSNLFYTVHRTIFLQFTMQYNNKHKGNQDEKYGNWCWFPLCWTGLNKIVK